MTTELAQTGLDVSAEMEQETFDNTDILLLLMVTVAFYYGKKVLPVWTPQSVFFEKRALTKALGLESSGKTRISFTPAFNSTCILSRILEPKIRGGCTLEISLAHIDADAVFLDICTKYTPLGDLLCSGLLRPLADELAKIME